MMGQLLEKWKSMGLLRNMLHLLAGSFLLLLPFSEPKRVLEGWDLLWGGIIPALAPIIFIVLMFDVMMCNIMKSDASDARIDQLRFNIRAHLTIGLLVLGFWLYSFAGVLFP